MTNPTAVRLLKPKDSAAIAALHHKAFKNFFLTSLGLPFLEVFYKAILSHRLGVGIGIYSGDDLAGFAIGTQNSTGFYKSLVYRNGLRLALAALPRLVLSPLTVNRLLIPLLARNDTQYYHLPSLLSICVSPAFASKGIGKQLLEEFEAELIKGGFGAVILTTDSHNNDNVNRFYRNKDYVCVQSILHGKREMNLYHKKLVSQVGR